MMNDENRHLINGEDVKGDKGHYNDWPVTTPGHYASEVAGIATDKYKYEFKLKDKGMKCPKDGLNLGDSQDEVTAMACTELTSVFEDCVQNMHRKICKRDGICEDGGTGSLGYSCPWGGDCQVCGPRNRSDAVKEIALTSDEGFRIAYGRPTKIELDGAYQFLCIDTQGAHYQQALVSRYTEFHGAQNELTAKK